MEINFKTIALVFSISLMPGCSPDHRPPVNSNPEARFVLEADAPNLPAEVTVKAIAGYEVESRDCLAVDYTKAIGGVKTGSRRWEPVEAKKLKEGTYQVIVFDDFYRESRIYPWKKKCVWKLSNVSFKFVNSSLMRSAGIGRNEILAREKETAFCSFSNVDMQVDRCLSVKRDDDRDYLLITIVRR